MINDKKLQELIGFVPHAGQEKILKCDNREIVISAGRRWGKSVICAYKALKILMEPNKKIWIVAPSYDLTGKVFEYVSKWFLKIIPEEGDRVSFRQPAKIRTSWGSILECKSTDNPVGLLGEEVDLEIIDEAARIPRNIFSQYLYPVTSSRKGQMMVISCITKDSYVLTPLGLKQISSFPFTGSAGKKQRYEGKLYGKNGFQSVGYIWQNKKMKTKRITVEGGYEIEGTLHHPILARDTIYKKYGTWTELKDITKNHFAVLQLNQQIFGDNDSLNFEFIKNNRHHKLTLPKKVNNDLAYLIGLLLGDGYVGERDITIINKDVEIIEFLKSKPFSLNFSESDRKNGTIGFKAGSDEFIYLLKYLGYEKKLAKSKKIPEKCLEWSKENICSLLRGLFDTDGCAVQDKNKRSRIIYASTSKDMITQVQFLLLNLGIVSSLRKQIVKPTRKVKVTSTVYTLEISQPIGIKRFNEQIGFRIKRKKDRCHYKLKNWQRKYYKNEHGEFCWKRVTKIEDSENETFDFNIPTEHNFFSNGFISHNTPFGKNWFYEHWLTQKEQRAAFSFESRTNPTFPEGEWERAKEQLPDAVFRQEYMATFLEDGASTFRNIESIVEDCLAEPEKGHTYALGADLAKYNDFTVLTVLDLNSGKVVAWDRFKDIDYTIQKNRIRALSTRYNGAEIVLDTTGVGIPIFEDLNASGCFIEDFKFSSKSKQALIAKLQMLIEQRKIRIPREDILIDELNSYGFERTENGNYVFSAPEGKHDDAVVSLALACWKFQDTFEPMSEKDIDTKLYSTQYL